MVLKVLFFVSYAILLSNSALVSSIILLGLSFVLIGSSAVSFSLIETSLYALGIFILVEFKSSNIVLSLIKSSIISTGFFPVFVDTFSNFAFGAKTLNGANNKVVTAKSSAFGKPSPNKKPAPV